MLQLVSFRGYLLCKYLFKAFTASAVGSSSTCRVPLKSIRAAFMTMFKLLRENKCLKMLAPTNPAVIIADNKISIMIRMPI